MKITAIKIDKDKLQFLGDVDLPNYVPIQLSFLNFGSLFLAKITGIKKGKCFQDIDEHRNQGFSFQSWKRISDGKIINLYYNLSWTNIFYRIFFKILGIASLLYFLTFFLPWDCPQFNSSQSVKIPENEEKIFREKNYKEFTIQGWIALGIFILTNMGELNLKELSISLSQGITLNTLQKLDQVKQSQEQNKEYINQIIRFLLKNHLKPQEWEIVHDLYYGDYHKFEPTANLSRFDRDDSKLENQIRRLRDLGLIVRKDGCAIEFPWKELEHRDLNDFLILTEDAIMNIQFIDKVVIPEEN